MLKKELSDIIATWRARLIILFVICIPVYDFFTKVWGQYSYYWSDPASYPNGLYPDEIYHPAMAAFLSGGELDHTPQMLLEWLLPIWCLLMCGDFYVREYRSGYVPVVSVRAKQTEIFLAKNLAGFIVMFSTMALSLLLNYILCGIAFRGGTSFRGLEMLVGDMGWLFDISLTYPELTYLLYIFLFSIVAGILCCICISLSFLLCSYKLLYSVCFILWFVLICLPNNIIYVIQPFTEYGLSYMLSGLGTFLVVAALAIGIGYIRKVKYETI